MTLVDEGAAKLLNCLSVCALHISHLGLGANGIRSLSDVSMDAFRGNELRMLSLRDNHLGVDGSLDLAQRLRNAENLTALYVSNNSISDDGLRYLLASLTPHSDAALQPTISGVRCLDASSNGIGKKGCAEFAAFVALPGVRLLKLDLSFNPGIGDDGLTILDEPLADAPSLRHLTLLSCGVQDTKSYTVETRSGYTVRVELDDAEEVSDSDGEDA
ncbi:RAN GTPase-activating protein 1 [Diplonema papillatum]|nr:RAN GTPase-activating protein 1 [Diplonema papillatum]